MIVATDFVSSGSSTLKLLLCDVQHTKSRESFLGELQFTSSFLLFLSSCSISFHFSSLFFSLYYVLTNTLLQLYEVTSIVRGIRLGTIVKCMALTLKHLTLIRWLTRHAVRVEEECQR